MSVKPRSEPEWLKRESLEWYIEELRRLANEHTPELAFSHLRGEPVEYVHVLLSFLIGARGNFKQAWCVCGEAMQRIRADHGMTPATKQASELLLVRYVDAKMRWIRHHPDQCDKEVSADDIELLPER